MTEIAGAAAAADILAGDQRRTPVEDAEAHGDCANCATPLQGPYCHACGQKAHLHGKLWHLVEEFLEGVAHFDGRLWRTLPLLAFRPGTLSRRWREGKRVRYVAPLHVFLFAIFLLFIIPTFTGRHLVSLPEVRASDAEVQEAQAAVRDVAGSPVDIQIGERGGDNALNKAWKKAKENPELYSYKLETLSYKLSFMVVPISMAILWVLMLFKRGYTLYDHGVVALYGVGFLALMISLVTALPGPAANIATRAVALIAPVHAIVHLHGAYRLSWFGAVLRGLLLGLFSSVGFGLFMLGVIAAGVLS